MQQYIIILCLLLTLTGCYLPNSRDNQVDRKAKITTLAVIGTGLGTEYMMARPSHNLSKLGFGGAKSHLATGVVAGVGSIYALEELEKKLNKHDYSLINTLKLESLDAENFPDERTYSNPKTGVKSTIRTYRTFIDDKDQVCREFDETLEVQNQKVTKQRIACQNTAGFWMAF